MKMPRLPKLPTLPKFSKLKLPQMRRPKRKLDARVRAGAAPMVDEYDEDEPQTKLSSAFVIVLLLHVVAVGGIYAFNSIKASRRTLEPTSASANAAAPKTATAAAKPIAAESGPVAAAQMTAPPAANIAPVSKQLVYPVKQGDTLTSVARRFGVGVADLELANSLKPTATLRVGQSLNIPAKGSAVEAPRAELRPPATATPRTSLQSYTVKSGDRLLFIAKRYNVTPDALAALNKIKDPSKLQVGQTLRIPPKKAN